MAVKDYANYLILYQLSDRMKKLEAVTWQVTAMLHLDHPGMREDCFLLATILYRSILR